MFISKCGACLFTFRLGLYEIYEGIGIQGEIEELLRDFDEKRLKIKALREWNLGWQC